jgi:hypothetical protein
MFRVLVLIGAFLSFRVMLPSNPKRSPTAITPYMNALDAMLSSQQVSFVIDEAMPYDSWLASRRTDTRNKVQNDNCTSNSKEDGEYAISAAHGGQSSHIHS